MTDYIDSEINVYGKKDDLNCFKSDVSGKENTVLDFNKIIPMPEDVSAWDKNEDNSGWYYWQHENWGVKWGVRYATVNDMKSYLAYDFDCPGGAPKPIFLTLAKRYPSLNFDIITYDFSDVLLLEMKSRKGKLLKYRLFEYVPRKSESGIIGYEFIENDCLANRLYVHDEPLKRTYKPLV